jgi:hypothetical protein
MSKNAVSQVRLGREEGETYDDIVTLWIIIVADELAKSTLFVTPVLLPEPTPWVLFLSGALLPRFQHLEGVR